MCIHISLHLYIHLYNLTPQKIHFLSEHNVRVAIKKNYFKFYLHLLSLEHLVFVCSNAECNCKRDSFKRSHWVTRHSRDGQLASLLFPSSLSFSLLSLHIYEDNQESPRICPIFSLKLRHFQLAGTRQFKFASTCVFPLTF